MSSRQEEGLIDWISVADYLHGTEKARPELSFLTRYGRRGRDARGSSSVSSKTRVSPRPKSGSGCRMAHANRCSPVLRACDERECSKNVCRALPATDAPQSVTPNCRPISGVPKTSILFSVLDFVRHLL